MEEKEPEKNSYWPHPSSSHRFALFFLYFSMEFASHSFFFFFLRPYIAIQLRHNQTAYNIVVHASFVEYGGRLNLSAEL